MIKIGQIVPSSNTTAEYEVSKIMSSAAENFSFHSTRIKMTDVSKEALLKMNQDFKQSASLLQDAKIDIGFYACMIALLVGGECQAEEIIKELNLEIVLSTKALIYGLKKLKAKNVFLITPYSESLTNLVEAYLVKNDINVSYKYFFNEPDNYKVGQLDQYQIRNYIEEKNLTNIDTIIVSACVQMPSINVLQQIEDEFKIPAISTSSCTAKLLLDKLKIDSKPIGYGSLFQ
jgi:maleate isomerase